MKHRLLWRLCMLLLLIGLVWLISNNQGYVLVVRAPYRVQFSFNFLLVLFVLSFLVLHYCLRFVHYLRKLPANKRNKKAAERLQASNEALLESLYALAEGDYTAAETATKRANDLIKDVQQEMKLEKLLQTMAQEKNRQGHLFKE